MFGLLACSYLHHLLCLHLREAWLHSSTHVGVAQGPWEKNARSQGGGGRGAEEHWGAVGPQAPEQMVCRTPIESEQRSGEDEGGRAPAGSERLKRKTCLVVFPQKNSRTMVRLKFRQTADGRVSKV